MPTINYNFKIDGFWHSANYYRSITPMTPEAMPTPTATGIAGLTFSDTTAEANKTYYVRFGSVKGSTEKISGEILVSTSEELWTPLNLLVPPLIYLDSDSIAISNNLVTQWLDKSGNNNHFLAPTSDAQKPTLNSLNSLDTVLTNGTSSYLNNNNLDLFRNKSSGWAFCLYNRIAGGNVLSHNASTTRPANLRFGFADVFGSARTDSGSVINTASDGTLNNEWNFKTYIANWGAGQHRASRNGGDYVLSPSFSAGNTSDTSSQAGTTIGKYTPSNNIYSSSEVACLVMGVDIPSQSDIQKLEGWAAHKWGLSDKLPADHPYKYAPPVV